MTSDQPHRRTNPSREEEAAAHPVREYVTYLLGGGLTFGLVGWIVGLISHHGWIVYVGVGVGLLAGLYLAWRHDVDRRRAAQHGKNS